MIARTLTAADFADAGAAAVHARDAAVEAHDFAVVVALALSTENGFLSLNVQESVCTVAQYAAAKVREARDAADIADGMFRTSRGGR